MYIFKYMELFTLLVIVLLASSPLESENLKEVGGSLSLELNADIEKYEDNIRKHYEDLKILENEIAEEEQQLNSARLKYDTFTRQNYESLQVYISYMRNKLLELYPTLCLPKDKATGLSILNLSTDSFEVSCEENISGPGWIVIQRRIRNGSIFNRNWEGYINGFGNPSEDYFIGLEKLYQLTSKGPHELLIYLESLNDETRYGNYDDFKIGSYVQAFQLESLGKFSGDAGNALQGALSNHFRVSYEHSGYYSGWWINDDQSGRGSNLNAVYSQWYTWPEAFKSVQMMIRPHTLNYKAIKAYENYSKTKQESIRKCKNWLPDWLGCYI